MSSPADTRKFCHFCGQMKEPELFATRTMCRGCKLERKKLHIRRVALPPPLWPVRHWNASKIRSNYKANNADKARVCELFFGFGVPIKVISEIECWKDTTVNKIISEYLGDRNAEPIYFKISAD